jgi:hypothetical protein
MNPAPLPNELRLADLPLTVADALKQLELVDPEAAKVQDVRDALVTGFMLGMGASYLMHARGTLADWFGERQREMEELYERKPNRRVI